MANRIQLRRGTAAEWAAKNPILAPGEPGVESDTGQEKFGDGVTRWNLRPYAKPGQQGIPGRDGSNVATTRTAVAQELEDPASPSRAVLSATVAEQVFKPSKYGAVDTTGAADSSPAIRAAILAALANGGTVELPAGIIRYDPQLVFPVSSLGFQKSVRITGQGRISNWPISGGANGATILDLRYAGAGHKIETYGQGVLEIDHLTLADGGTSSTPFLLTVGTTLHAHDIAVLGNPSKSRETCDQDVFILGGLDGTTSNNGPTNAFQGYGTVIERVLFEKIRTGVMLRRFANSVVVAENSFSNRCGSNNLQGAIEFDPGTGAAVVGGEPEAFASANVIRDNLIEVYGYRYGIRLMNKSYLNLLTGNAFWDQHRTDYIADIHFGVNASGNTVMGTTVQTRGKNWEDLNGTNTFMGMWDEVGVGPLSMIRVGNAGLHVRGGGVRLQNNGSFYIKDSTGADRQIATLGTSNTMIFGDVAAVLSNQSVIMRVGATGSVGRLRAGTADMLQFSSVGVGFNGKGPQPMAPFVAAVAAGDTEGLRSAVNQILQYMKNSGLMVATAPVP